MDVSTVLDYLTQASAAGVIGTGSYVAVSRLANWAREHLRWEADHAIEIEAVPLAPEAESRLAELYLAARAEWNPTSIHNKGNQTVRVGRDLNAPVINMPGGHIGSL